MMKRGRGRPPGRGRKRPANSKFVSPVIRRDSPDAGDTGDGTPAPEKRGRGRPRKTPIKDDLPEAIPIPDIRSDSDEGDTGDVKPAPEKRSRAGDTGNGPLATEKKGRAGETGNVTPVPEKRGAGRPRKTPIKDDLPEAIPIPVVRRDSEAGDTGHGTPVPEKRGAGRPRKIPIKDDLPEAIPIPAVRPDSDEGGIGDVTPAPEKKGRAGDTGDGTPALEKRGRAVDTGVVTTAPEKRGRAISGGDTIDATPAPEKKGRAVETGHITPAPEKRVRAIDTGDDTPAPEKRGRGRPRKTPINNLPETIPVPVNSFSIVSPPKKQPILTTVKSGKPLTTRPPVLSENKLTITSKKPVSTVRLTTTADPIPPRSSFSSLPQVQQHIRPYPSANQAKFNSKKMTTLSKYMETLPEISQCVLPADYDVKENFEKLPDKIVLISTELPFNLAEAVEHSDETFLFRQAINPGVSDSNPIKHSCLLCKGSDLEYSNKEQRELQNHYSAIHELQVQLGSAKYSDEMVYICLPSSMIPQVNEENPDLKLSCQYCQPALFPLSTIKEHYETEHGKGVEFIVQEDLNEQYNKFSCSICFHTSSDFEQHHLHMRAEHQLKTFKCKSCSFVTADETRMRTHFKAKHMLHNSGQNLQCNYCRGLLIGKERLNKHVQQSHMVLTGREYSCIACRQVVPKGSPLYVHAENCTPANQGIILEKCTKRYITRLPALDMPGDDQYDCYFCNVRIDGKDNYDRHLTHAHMIWVTNPAYVVDSTASEQTHKTLTIDDMLTDEELAAAHVETFVGHWCRCCDIMIRCYQLYYLHMANHHRMSKVFQCIISGCGSSFDSFEKFIDHIEEEGHSQKTIISHPDQVHVCVYCDLYFANKTKLIEHLISDSHINKFTNSGHFQRTEARNYKCKACFTMFGMKESYIHHLETESHQYVCPACMIVTAQSAARRAHIQNSHHELINQCDECGELHNSDSDLTTHFVQHGFTFPCPECPKKFYQREKLNAHMEVHQGEIVCDWEGCGKKIATTSMLVTHYRNHKSNHKCRFCNQSFWNENMLQSHMRSHRPALKQTRGGTMFRRDQNAYSRVKACEYCDALLKSPREINSHRCAKMPVNKRMLDLVTRAASEISPSTVSTNSTSSKYAPMETDDANHMNESETQVIMILNQNTGELMEITAPINMAVQDVIDAMQSNDGEFGAAIEEADVEALEVDTLNAVTEHNEQTYQQEILAAEEQKIDDQQTEETVSVEEQKPEDGGEEEGQAGEESQEVVEESQVVEEEPVAEFDNTEAGPEGEPAAEEVILPATEVIDAEHAESVQVETVEKPADDADDSQHEPESLGEKLEESVVTEQVVKAEGADGDQEEEVYQEDGGEQFEVVEESQVVEQTVAEGEEGIEYQEEGEDGREVIIVSANMLNPDGSIVLDSETIERYNLQVGEDGSILSNHTFVVADDLL